MADTRRLGDPFLEQELRNMSGGMVATRRDAFAKQSSAAGAPMIST